MGTVMYKVQTTDNLWIKIFIIRSKNYSVVPIDVVSCSKHGNWKQLKLQWRENLPFWKNDFMLHRTNVAIGVGFQPDDPVRIPQLSHQVAFKQMHLETKWVQMYKNYNYLNFKKNDWKCILIFQFRDLVVDKDITLAIGQCWVLRSWYFITNLRQNNEDV